MKVVVIDRHDGEGQFPTFHVGETIHNLQPCDESAHWMSCAINGFDTSIPDKFVYNTALVREYNPTELIAREDEILEIEEIAYEWLYGKNEKGEHGWIPAEKVLSISFRPIR